MLDFWVRRQILDGCHNLSNTWLYQRLTRAVSCDPVFWLDIFKTLEVNRIRFKTRNLQVDNSTIIVSITCGFTRFSIKIESGIMWEWNRIFRVKLGSLKAVFNSSSFSSSRHFVRLTFHFRNKNVDHKIYTTAYPRCSECSSERIDLNVV